MNTSPINQCSKEEFSKICESYDSLADIIRHFKLSAAAGNYKTLKRRIIKDGVDISHIKLGSGSNRNRRFERKYTKEYLLEGGEVPSHSVKELKRYLIEYGILKQQCQICGQGNTWNNLPLVLQMDHINGNREDNSIENLRLVCPNCHTQTTTFSGKKTNKKRFIS
jgi:5-methylcytosine-specific restriction endonuclease McrA